MGVIVAKPPLPSTPEVQVSGTQVESNASVLNFDDDFGVTNPSPGTVDISLTNPFFTPTNIGQLIYSFDGVLFRPSIPVTTEEGFIVTTEDGFLVVF